MDYNVTVKIYTKLNGLFFNRLKKKKKKIKGKIEM